MERESTDADSQKEVSQLLSSSGFPEEGKKVLGAMNQRIRDLTRENLMLKKENTDCRP